MTKTFPKPPIPLEDLNIKEPPAEATTGPTDSKAMVTKAQSSLEGSAFILETTLITEHQDDPTILKFIDIYLNCRDVNQASKEVGIHPSSGKALLKRHDIHKAISKLTQMTLNKYGFDAHDIVEKVKEVGFVDISELENEDGTYKTSLRAISPETRRAIKKFKVKNIWETDPNGMKVVTGEIIEVEMWDKMKAIDMLGREVDLFKEKKVIEHAVSGNMKEMLLESRERAEKAIADSHEANVIDVTPKGEVDG